MEREYLELRAAIDRLKRADPQHRVFGATNHKYAIGPRRTEDEIRAWETDAGVELPEDARLYLTLVGDGNGAPRRPHGDPLWYAMAGPGYGVWSLADWVAGERVHAPFPFTVETTDPDDPIFEEWDGDVPGAIEISTFGCSTHAHLIVTGPQRGLVWSGDSYCSFAPTGLTFTRWIRDWAEEELAVIEKRPVLARLAVGMTADEVAAATGETWNRSEIKGRTMLTCRALRATVWLDESGRVAEIESP